MANRYFFTLSRTARVVNGRNFITSEGAVKEFEFVNQSREPVLVLCIIANANRSDIIGVFRTK